MCSPSGSRADGIKRVVDQVRPAPSATAPAAPAAARPTRAGSRRSAFAGMGTLRDKTRGLA